MYCMILFSRAKLRKVQFVLIQQHIRTSGRLPPEREDILAEANCSAIEYGASMIQLIAFEKMHLEQLDPTSFACLRARDLLSARSMINL